jgi:hypothetical protein
MTIPLGFIANAKSIVTGGTLTSDSTYYYRTFTSSGSLSITGAPLTYDALIIGGGGSSGHSGWWSATGGGGAGGVRLVSAAKAPIGNHSAVIGAGGVIIDGGGGQLVGTSGGNSSFKGDEATGGYRGGSLHRTGLGGDLSGGSQGSPTGYSGGGYGAQYWDGAAGGGGGGGAAGNGTSAQEALYQGQYIYYIPGVGGAGTSDYSAWASVTGTGVSGVYAKGGNGFASGTGTTPPSTPQPANSGNGGYGEGAGGSGLVIVRYLKTAVAV